MTAGRGTNWSGCILGPGAAILGLTPEAGCAGATVLLVATILPLSIARQAAHAALTACERKGFHVSVAVTDHAGLMRDDETGPHTLDSSVKKAYTAASMGLSTGTLTKILAEHPDAAGLYDMNEKILILQGGLPIKPGAEILGGIGVGGTTGKEGAVEMREHYGRAVSSGPW